MRPLLRATSGVHEDGAAVEFGAGGGHGGIPEMTAYVVDNFGSRFDGIVGGDCVEGIYRNDDFGFLLEDGFDDGEDAGLFFVDGEWGGVGASGFAADVEDVGAFFEHGEGLGEGSLGGVIG